MDKRTKIKQHREHFWPTSDDWYPNFERNTVRVRISSTVTGGQAWARLSVWGADDDGRETDRHCRTADLPAVVRELNKLADSFPNPITKRWLERNGFVRS